MPLSRVPLTGNQAVAMANVSLENKTTFDNTASLVDKVFTFNELNVEGLPSLLYWIRLDSAVAGVVFQPVFSVTNVTTGGVTAPNWFPFTNGIILVPGNVTTFTIRAAVGLAGMQVTVPAQTALGVTTAITAGG